MRRRRVRLKRRPPMDRARETPAPEPDAVAPPVPIEVSPGGRVLAMSMSEALGPRTAADSRALREHLDRATRDEQLGAENAALIQLH